MVSTIRNLAKATVIAVYLLVQFFIWPLNYLFWLMVLQPLRLFSPYYYKRIFSSFYVSFCMSLGSWNDLAGHKISVVGQGLNQINHDEKVFILNHQNFGDASVFCRALNNESFVYEEAMWVMDWIFQFLPFGMVCKHHGDFFILQRCDVNKFSFLCGNYLRQARLMQQRRFITHTQNAFNKSNFNSVVLFPEGGFASKRKDSSQAYARANGFPVLKHVALPRVDGFANILDSFSDPDCLKKIEWVVDVTIAYPPFFGLKEHLLGWNCEDNSSEIVLMYKIYSAESLYENADDPTAWTIKLRDWLYNRFQEKDDMLKYYYEQGTFPGNRGSVRSAGKLDRVRLICFNVGNLIMVILAWFLFWPC